MNTNSEKNPPVLMAATIHVALCTIIVITILTNTPEDFEIRRFFHYGILLHKTGELLMVLGIGTPFLLSCFIPIRTVRKTTWIFYILALSGGILNYKAWVLVKGHYAWHVWCVALLVIGIISFLFIRMLVKINDK